LYGIIYTGKSIDHEINQGERIIKELAASFKNSGHNVTMDNFFTSLPIVKHLLWNLTIVETLKHNKTYIPEEMKKNKSREIYSSLFAYHEKFLYVFLYT